MDANFIFVILSYMEKIKKKKQINICFATQQKTVNI